MGPTENLHINVPYLRNCYKDIEKLLHILLVIVGKVL